MYRRHVSSSSAMAKQFTAQTRIGEIHRLARQRGGRCLTSGPVMCEDRVELECAERHRWTTSAKIATGGSWCPVCRYGRSDALAKIGQIVRERGGVLLSKQYDPMAVHVRCALGHEWVTRGNRLREGSWCPNCSHRHTIEDMRLLAVAQGGRLVSRRYEGNDEPLTWECAEGHQFRQTPQVVLRDTWCPECRRARGTVGQALKVIEQRGGTLLSRGKLLAKRRFRLRCREGHTWTALAAAIVGGRWCPECDERSSAREAARAKASELGGRFVSEYRDQLSRMKWECAEGHRFELSAAAVRRGRWCPECRREAGPVGRARAIAARRGGELLSTKFGPSRQPLKWRCKAGHEWLAVPHTIIDGHWCAQCAVRRLGIEEMHRMARQWGGRCLSTEYVKSTIPLLWRCDRRHEFWRAPSTIRQDDRFCPVCMEKARREQRRSDAKDRR
jgi:hypothetical protein